MTQKIVALVGRPNVGKSTLFNRLSINKKAIVHDKPGVTRDRKYAVATLGDMAFNIIDTPGFEEASNDIKNLGFRMLQQTKSAILEADLICLVLDVKSGVTPLDQSFAHFIRLHKQPHQNCLVILNKCEKNVTLEKAYYALGFGEPVQISAEHGLGMMGLYENIKEKVVGSQEPKVENIKTDNRPIKVVVAGRPNVGKSTFINAILAEERLLTGPEAGITREAIDISIDYKSHTITLVDTAGLRRKSLVKDRLEKLSTSNTIENINFADVVLLMVDSQIALQQQDLTIASYTIEQGRVLIIVVNKSDLIKDLQAFKKALEYKLQISLAQIKGIIVVYTSAIKFHGMDEVLEKTIEAYNLWYTKISTSKLNSWLQFTTSAHPPPLTANKRSINLKYITQTKTHPPTFKVFTNRAEEIEESYKRYLANSLRESFNLFGIPIRLLFENNRR